MLTKENHLTAPERARGEQGCIGLVAIVIGPVSK